MVSAAEVLDNIQISFFFMIFIESNDLDTCSNCQQCKLIDLKNKFHLLVLQSIQNRIKPKYDEQLSKTK